MNANRRNTLQDIIDSIEEQRERLTELQGEEQDYYYGLADEYSNEAESSSEMIESIGTAINYIYEAIDSIRDYAE